MTPTQDYLDRNPDVLAEMIADFQQRKKIVEMAKTKEPVDANVIENPNLRALIPYPKMMYNHTKRIMQPVENAREYATFLAQGWKEQPWPSVDAGVPIGPQSTSDPMADERLDSIEQRVLSMEQALGDMTATLAEIVKRLPEPRKPRQVQEG